MIGQPQAPTISGIRIPSGTGSYIMKVVTGILLILLLALQYRLWVGEGSVAEVSHLREQIEAQRAELARIKERNRALQAEVVDLRKGLEAIEERARSELGMIKKGEIFYQVIEDPSKPDP